MHEKTGKQRIVMVIEYDGHGLCGWQRQKDVPTVQMLLEDALARIDGERAPCLAAGRTDAGVHAEAMAVHADVDAARFLRSNKAYIHGLNSLLPEQIRVLGVRAVPTGFHARFDCRERAYRYQIWNRNTAPALSRWRHWWMPRRLNLEHMRQAAQCLLGRHDFSAFRASGCQAGTATRELRRLDVEHRGHAVSIHIRADAFLYHMARNIAGSLVEVGVGNWSPERMAEVLASKERSQAAATAPAHGLYFTDAVYDTFSSRDLAGN